MLLSLGRVCPRGRGTKSSNLWKVLADDDATGGIISNIEQEDAKGAGEGHGDSRLKGEIA